MVFDYAVIGAGPAGSYLAKKLVMRGASVAVFERESSVGVPVQCTGLLTDSLKEFVDVNNKFVVNKLDRVELNSRDSIKRFKINEFVVNRTLFDKYLMNQAVKCGAELFTSHSLVDYSISGGVFELVFNNKKRFKCRSVIGCDGPLSTVNKLFKMNADNKCFFAKQFVVKSSEYNKNCYSAYFGSGFNDFFAWRVPCGNNCYRIGLGNSDACSVNKRLEVFMKRFNSNVLDTNAGLIPIHNPERVVFKKFNDLSVYLMGDAAGIVKATTGGGIIPSFRMINESYKQVLEGVAPRFPKTRFELLAHLLLHNIISQFSDDEFNALLDDLGDERVSRLLSENSRDNIIGLVLKLIVEKPELLKYGKYFLKNLL